MRFTGQLLVICSAALVCFVGCSDSKKPGPSAATTTSATATAKPSADPQPAKPKEMPELTVDELGPYLGGQRADLKAKGGEEKLTKIVRELPINNNPVTLLVDKKAKVPDVAATVAELGAAGAPTITIKTDGRDDLPKQIVVTPESRISNIPACAVSAMVLKDLSTAVWPFGGGTGKRQRKGLAGPDLSHTGETLTKQLAACNSTVAFFSADDENPWELAFNLAGTVVISDEKKQINTLVLLRTAPVAGRPITLGKGN